MLSNEIVRYILNGIVATLVHYGLLNFNILVLGIAPVGLANFIAALFGIITSFIGSRYFVYKTHTNSLFDQIFNFYILYLCIAVLHGFVLYVWTDRYGLNYHLGFVCASILQVLLSYLGNKLLVFKIKKEKESMVKKWLVGMVLFIVILVTVYIIHLKFFRVDVVFYSAIFDGVLASIILALLLIAMPYFSVLNRFDRFQMVFTYILLGYIFAISIPTVIDRSLSFYLLEKIQQRGGGIKQSAFESVFVNEYMVEHRLVDVRLTEQLSSGTIKIKAGCVMLTPKGDALAKFSRFYRQNFLPKERLLMGKYTDDLTNPFGHGAVDGAKVFDYKCMKVD